MRISDKNGKKSELRRRGTPKSDGWNHGNQGKWLLAAVVLVAFAIMGFSVTGAIVYLLHVLSGGHLQGVSQ